MEILPKTLGTRPRLAVEIRWGGVVAARAEDASAGVLSAVSLVELPKDEIEPGLKAGNFKSQAAVVAAVRKTLEAVTEKGLGREVTLIVPDATVRVLLLDFDALPNKVAEALPVVRFRLKKLLPFDADDAALSYQVMSGTRNVAKGALRVVAVAIPREVLDEYEGVIRDAGFEPGAVLPSTLAAISGLDDGASPTLIVNAGPQAITTAIVEDGVLLLHRSVDMSGNVQVGILAESSVVMTDPEEGTARVPLLPLIDVEDSQQEWAMQEAVDPFGRPAVAPAEAEPFGRPVLVDPFAARVAARQLAQRQALALQDTDMDEAASRMAAEIEAQAFAEAAELRSSNGYHAADPATTHGYVREVTQAVSVAAAYFEDTLESSPGIVLSAGSTSARLLGEMLDTAGFGEIVEGTNRTRVQEIVDEESLVGQAVSAQIPKGWLAGVRGALRS